MRLGLLSTVALMGVVMSVSAHAAESSVKSGVYSAAQAERGLSVILGECARCHGNTLLGGENDTPPLVGAPFQSKWSGLTLGELFEKMYTTMPSDSPGRLSKSDYADALAYILATNKYPAGDKDLAANADALKQIKIEP